MPTTPQGIYYPDASTNVAPLHTVLATMASSIDNSLPDDTGWVTSGIAVTGNANFTVSAYSLRRIGKHIKGRITVTFTGNPLSSDASGDFANVLLPTIPTAWAPTGFSAPITMERVGAAVSFGWAETNGQLRLVSSSLQSVTVLATNATYVIYLDHFTG